MDEPKYGDGGAEILPLSGLTKRRLRTFERALGAPERLDNNVCIAEFESIAPQGSARLMGRWRHCEVMKKTKSHCHDHRFPAVVVSCAVRCATTLTIPNTRISLSSRQQRRLHP
ncbi:hypothetical protein PQQ99_29480 [Paraburkholderia sediminicola]|uniref:hypothetical protein n=1 Tax=Paraburkholderia sediminicola TaxID=458836 RepID=UPI0038B74CAB